MNEQWMYERTNSGDTNLRPIATISSLEQQQQRQQTLFLSFQTNGNRIFMLYSVRFCPTNCSPALFGSQSPIGVAAADPTALN
ncbi:hypothetical protein TYRP_010577 [Tyrophagus putrescentiae]|nr:hypothetical protein TYRP_010577 [Tyrophagus putrescentiae]